jgi:hypothetical protein
MPEYVHGEVIEVVSFKGVRCWFRDREHSLALKAA